MRDPSMGLNTVACGAGFPGGDVAWCIPQQRVLSAAGAATSVGAGCRPRQRVLLAVGAAVSEGAVVKAPVGAVVVARVLRTALARDCFSALVPAVLVFGTTFLGMMFLSHLTFFLRHRLQVLPSLSALQTLAALWQLMHGRSYNCNPGWLIG
jgi:hypothetical protein